MKSSRKGRVIPGFGLTTGITVSMLSLLILLPLASILVYSLRQTPAEFWQTITRPNVIRAFQTSILCAVIAAAVNTVVGLLLAWILVRYQFPGKRIIDGMIELPFALPTAVAGITLAKMYSNQGVLGQFLNKIGIQGSYTRFGIVIAMIFVGIPFVVRSIQPVLERIPASCEEAARTMGARRGYTFRRIILPELFPAMLTGFGLALARGIGEYGSVIYISGNSEKNGTQVVSYVIMQKLNAGNADYTGAASIALVLLVISFVLMLLINLAQRATNRRNRGAIEAASKNEGAELRNAYASGAREKTIRIVLITLAVIFFAIMLVWPLCSVFYRSLKDGLALYTGALTAHNTLSALRVTLIAAGFALAVDTFFALCASWLLTKFDFRGKNALSALIDIPFSISPVIAGLAFIMLFGRTGILTPVLNWINNLLGTNLALVFSIPGVVLATIFVTFPYVLRELIPIMNHQGRAQEEAAAMLGAGGFTIFRRITLPQIKWPLSYGMILCTARAFGEFGAVYAVSKARGSTFTLPLEVDALYMAGSAESITQAFAVSSLLVMMALAILIVKSILEYRSKRTKETDYVH